VAQTRSPAPLGPGREEKEESLILHLSNQSECRIISLHEIIGNRELRVAGYEAGSGKTQERIASQDL
jgi:hypothetical protein